MRLSEYLLALHLVGFLIFLFVFAKIQSSVLSLPTQFKAPLVSIVIEGEVAKPGSYETDVGTPLTDVLQKARPKRFADLKSLSVNDRVQAPMQIVVGKLKVLSLHIEGAVAQPGAFQVPVGTRLSDLKKILPISSEADFSFFNSQRLLFDGEILVVPKGKNKKTCK